MPLRVQSSSDSTFRDLLEALLAEAGDMLVAADTTLRVIAFNDAYAREFLQAHQRPLDFGLDLSAVLDPSATRRWRRALTGETFVAAQKANDEATPGRVLELRYAPLRSDGHGLGAVQLVRDVTERYRAEQRATAALRRYTSLVAALGEMAYDYDPGRDHLTWYGACKALLGWEAGELGTTQAERLSLIHPDDVNRVRDALQQVGTQATRYSLEYRCRHRDGHYLWVHDRGWRKDAAGDSSALVVGLVGDITERRRLADEVRRYQDHLEEMVAARGAELARSNVELQQFAYVASHDLQEPLRMVTSFCQLLQRRYGRQLNDEANEYIRFAVDGAERMQKLIQDLLALARVGRTRTLQPVDAGEACDRALANLRGSIEERRGVVLREPLPLVRADPTQLTQVFQNLIHNALKFCHVAPQVRISAQPDGSDSVFAVQDNGIGIAPEHQSRIFRVFQRLHPRNAYPGNGIGLTLCHKIIEQHGGRLWVRSEAGSGSTFFFRLPLVQRPVAGEQDR